VTPLSTFQFRYLSPGSWVIHVEVTIAFIAAIILKQDREESTRPLSVAYLSDSSDEGFDDWVLDFKTPEVARKITMNLDNEIAKMEARIRRISISLKGTLGDDHDLGTCTRDELVYITKYMRFLALLLLYYSSTRIKLIT
jgi:hypothetical protein